MLEIYNQNLDVNNLVESRYLEYFENEKNYEDILKEEDILILNEEKYTIDEIIRYLEFYKYKPINGKKMSVINDFDKINIKLQNKLLKIFEESEYLHIIVAKNSNKILPTILSRGQIKRIEQKREVVDNYPERYEKIILEFDMVNKFESSIIDKYLKIFDLIKTRKYLDLYLFLTTSFIEYDEQIVYDLMQNPSCNIEVEYLLSLQERLFSNASKKLQMENMILEMSKRER